MMKKTLIVLSLILAMLLGSVGVFENSVKAEEYTTVQDSLGYNYSCGNSYEVDEVGDDGNFHVKGCYLSLSDAKNKMKENEDYVVRYSKGRSPMKIVAMNGGLVYGYPARKNKSTLYVYENESETGLTTYVSSYREMVYEDTMMVNTSDTYGGYGIIKVNLNGFEGYTDLELVDLIPFKFIDKEISCYTGVSSSNCTKFVIRQNYFIAKQNGSYKDLYFNYAISVKHPTAYDAYESGEFVIGSAPKTMDLNKKYYSKDGVVFYTDNHYKNYAFTNYNYFQWLSVRSEAEITADQLNAYLNKMNRTNSAFYGTNAQAFIDGQNTYGMNALLVFALACNESAYGTELIEANNIFGLGAYDGAEKANAFAFDSISECIADFEGWHLAKYCDYYFKEKNGFVYYTAPYFGNKGVGISVKYMSDPYECYKVAGIAYSIDKFINNYDGTYTNNNAYNIALVNSKGINFYASQDNKSAVLYRSYAGNYTEYQKDNVVTVLETYDEYTKVISSNPVNENREVIQTNGLTSYVHEDSYAYIENKNITPLNYVRENPESIGEYSFDLTYFNWTDENKLNIKASVKTENLKENGSCYLLLDGEKDYRIRLDSKQENDVLGINSDVDVSEIVTGDYLLRFETEYESEKYNQITNIDSEAIFTKVISSKVYSFKNESEALALNVSEYKENSDEYESLLVLNDMSLSMNDNEQVELYIKGIGVIKGVDSKVKGETEHELVLKEMGSNKEIVFELTDASSYFSINDGHKYNEAGFEGTVVLDALEDLTYGSYMVMIRTRIDEIEAVSSLKTVNTDYANIALNNKENSLIYRVSFNDFELNRIELDVEHVYEEIDYKSINKVDSRTSFSNITKIEFKDEKLVIDAACMIYYLDYDIKDEIGYNVYLVNDETGNIITMNTVKTANKYRYQDNFKSDFNMDNISFEADIELDKITSGNYRIVVEITKNDTKTYKDYIEFVDKFGIDRGTFNSDDLSYSFFVSDVRDRLMLKVEDR